MGVGGRTSQELTEVTEGRIMFQKRQKHLGQTNRRQVEDYWHREQRDRKRATEDCPVEVRRTMVEG